MTKSIREKTSNLDSDQQRLGNGDDQLTILVIPFIEYQAAFRFVCSLLLHHIWVMATKVGATCVSGQ